MDKDRFAVSRGPCSWLEMHQFIGDLMTSSSAQPVKDPVQQEALRAAWETAGNEALGLRITPQVQNRQSHTKGGPGCSLQPLNEPVERSGEAANVGQPLQHRSCTCPACPLSSSFSPSSSATFQTLRPREGPSLQNQSAQMDPVRPSKESSAGPVSLGLCLGLGLSLEEEASDQIAPCSLEPEVQQQQQQQHSTDRVVSSHIANASTLPAFPCLCCHRGFQTCAQLLRHQQGPEPHFPHPHHHYHLHHHHCALTSCLPCPQLAPHPQSPPPFPCLSCQRTFQTCAQLLRHQQGHSQQEGVPQHPCMPCSASFPRPTQLLQHQRSPHASKTGGHLCAECGRAFNSPSNLRVHLNVHTGARPYTCADCGKSFSQSGALKIHRRIHTGERPYTCDFCGRGFPHLAGVRAHQRTHTGEKPYRCPQCGKCFTQSGALKIHLRIHTGERPFVCGLCGKGFSNRAGIRFHHRTVHGIASEAGLNLPAAASGRPGLSLLSSAIFGAGLVPETGRGLAVSPDPSLSPDADARPAGNPAVGRPGSSLASGSVSSSLSSPSSTFSLEAAPLPSKVAPQRSAPAGQGKKPLTYACEDCGLRFGDALSRNKHQELEHYPDLEEEGGEEGEEEEVELGPEEDVRVREAVDSMVE